MNQSSTGSANQLEELQRKYTELGLSNHKPCDFPQKLPLGENVVVEKIIEVHSINDFYILAQRDAAAMEYLELCLGSILAFGADPYRIGDPDLKTQIAVYNCGPQEWKRLKIIDFLPDAKVKVFYIDCGTTEIIEQRYLRVLPSQFLESPPFAIHCSLDVVVTEYEGDDRNPHEELAAFLKDKLCGESASKTNHLDNYVKANCLRRIPGRNGPCHIVRLLRFFSKDWGTELVEAEWAKRMIFEGDAEEPDQDKTANVQDGDGSGNVS